MAINRKEINLNILKKNPYTGSYKGIRFLFQKQEEEEKKFICVTVWPGPFNYASTPEEKKEVKVFDFDKEGLDAAIEWVDNQWEEKKDYYMNLPPLTAYQASENGYRSSY